MNLYQGPIWNRLYGGLGHLPQPWQCVHQCETGEKMNPEARCPWFRWKIIVAHILIFCHKVSVLEERLCDFKKWRWTPFDRHIDHFNLTKMGTGKVTMAAMMMTSLLSAHNCISSLLMIWVWQICHIWYTNTKDRPAILFQALLMWPTGIASEESIHGAAQLLMKSIRKIRAAFTFRKKFRWNSNRF